MVSKYEQLQSTLSVLSGNSRGGYPPRFHNDVEMTCVQEGVLEIQIDGVSYALKPGDVCVAFPNILHSVTRQECRKHLIMISPTLVPQLSKLLFQNKPLCPVLPAETVPDIVPLLFQRCAQLYTTQKNQAVQIAYVNCILNELLPHMTLEARSSEPGLVQSIVEFILAGYTEDISLEKLAQAIGYSKFHISRCLRDTFGCNFRTLVNNYRISAAEDMLLRSKSSILEIAYACGFQNQSSFNRVFLKHCGMTPSQYQKINCSSF